MENLIKVNKNGEPTVSGRQLHMFLDIGTEYTKWFSRMCEYGFDERNDFNSVNFDEVRFEGSREVKRTLQNHEMTLDMAKEIAMIQRNERGKQARQYFISIEKEWNSPEKIMARALLIANEQKEELIAKIEADKPKVLFADSVAVSAGTMLVRELAKIITQNGYQIGEKKLFEWLRCNGYLIKKLGKDYNSPTQKAMQKGLFEISETTINHNSGAITTKTTTRVTGKGQIYFVNKFKEMLLNVKAGLIVFADARALKEGAAL